MSFKLDHVVIAVEDLETAIQEYTEQGFVVVPGGEHPGGITYNALVSFSDGSYLELLGFKRPAPEHRWWRQVEETGYGLLDFAFLSSNLAEDVAGLKGRGLDYGSPEKGGRLRPDGEKLEWKTSLAPFSGLPFLIEDVTLRNLRVPDGPAWEHKNGVTGIKELSIVVAELEKSARRFQALLGRGGETVGFTKGFTVGDTQILLAPPLKGELAYERPQPENDLPLSLHLSVKDGPDVIIS